MESGAMGNVELIQAIAELNWAQNDDPEMFEKIATFRVGYEIYQRMSGEREREALRSQTIAAIAKYVNDHPKATKEELQKEIAKRIVTFAQKVENL